MLSIKSGVDVRSVSLSQLLIIQVVSSVYEQFRTDCTVTDLWRERSPDARFSFHHVDRAVDFRLKHVGPDLAADIVQAVADALPFCDVIAHGEGDNFHLHVEYDPREE